MKEQIINDNSVQEVIEAVETARKTGISTVTYKSVKITINAYITNRVKSYKDACDVRGVQPVNEKELAKLGFTKSEIALRKLKIISEALNEGWNPNWLNSSVNKFYPVFYVIKDKNKHGNLALLYISDTNDVIGNLIYFKTRELALYAANRFISLYNDYLL